MAPLSLKKKHQNGYRVIVRDHASVFCCDLSHHSFKNVKAMKLKKFNKHRSVHPRLQIHQYAITLLYTSVPEGWATDLIFPFSLSSMLASLSDPSVGVAVLGVMNG